MNRRKPIKRSSPEDIAAWRRRSKPPKRSPLSRSGRIKPVGRRGAKLKRMQFGEQASHCRESPCCVCGAPPPSDPHHEPPRSRGGLDSDTAPLCRSCHRRRHELGSAEAFEAETGVDLVAVAKEIDA